MCLYSMLMYPDPQFLLRNMFRFIFAPTSHPQLGLSSFPTPMQRLSELCLPCSFLLPDRSLCFKKVSVCTKGGCVSCQSNLKHREQMTNVESHSLFFSVLHQVSKTLKKMNRWRYNSCMLYNCWYYYSMRKEHAL